MPIPFLQNWLSSNSSAQGLEPLSVIDTAWLRMDRPTNLMMICGMMIMAGPVELQKLKDVLQHRMLCFHRFRQRVIYRGGKAYWEVDPHFDLDWHVRRIALPEGDNALQEVMSDLTSTPLDPTKPMWQYHVIDHVGNGSAIVLRIHHCYGDGFALMHVVSSMTDIDPDHPHADGQDVPGNGAAYSAWERIFGPITETVGGTLRTSMSVVNAGLDLLNRPGRAVDYALKGTDLLYQAGVIANMTPDSPTRFKGPLGVMKRVAWAPPLSLFEVKALSNAFDCSVNDVVVSCVAGALRAYLLEQGDAVEGTEVRAMVPVNMRPPRPITELGNGFGLVFLDLPLGIEDPIQRLLEVHKRMEALKHSQQALVALGILAAMGMAPDFLKERVLEALAANASAVVTNVRGTDEPRYFVGERILRHMFWVPQSGGIGVGISILSYAGEVSFGVVTDVQRVANPELITQRFSAEFEGLLLNALMMPWASDPTAGNRTDAGRQRSSAMHH